MQNYYHAIKSEFRKVPDLTDREKLNFFRTGLSDELRAGAHSRRELGTLFETMEDLFRYLQLDEAMKVVVARGKSLTDKHDRHQRGGYANHKSKSPFKRPAETRYLGKDLTFNRVQFTKSPPSDSGTDSFSSQGLKTTDDGGEMNSRPAKSPELEVNGSRNPAAGRGGGGRRATQLTHIAQAGWIAKVAGPQFARC